MKSLCEECLIIPKPSPRCFVEAKNVIHYSCTQEKAQQHFQMWFFYILLSIVLPILWKWDWLVLLDTLAIVICCLAGCANQRPGADAVGFRKGTRTLYDYNGRFITGQLVVFSTWNVSLQKNHWCFWVQWHPVLTPLLNFDPLVWWCSYSYCILGHCDPTQIFTVLVAMSSRWRRSWYPIILPSLSGNGNASCAVAEIGCFKKNEHTHASHSWQTNYKSIRFRLLLAGGSLSPQCDPTQGWRIHNGSGRDFQC